MSKKEPKIFLKTKNKGKKFIKLKKPIIKIISKKGNKILLEDFFYPLTAFRKYNSFRKVIQEDVKNLKDNFLKIKKKLNKNKIVNKNVLLEMQAKQADFIQQTQDSLLIDREAVFAELDAKLKSIQGGLINEQQEAFAELKSRGVEIIKDLEKQGFSQKALAEFKENIFSYIEAEILKLQKDQKISLDTMQVDILELKEEAAVLISENNIKQSEQVSCITEELKVLQNEIQDLRNNSQSKSFQNSLNDLEERITNLQVSTSQEIQEIILDQDGFNKSMLDAVGEISVEINKLKSDFGETARQNKEFNSCLEAELKAFKKEVNVLNNEIFVSQKESKESLLQELLFLQEGVNSILDQWSQLKEKDKLKATDLSFYQEKVSIEISKLQEDYLLLEKNNNTQLESLKKHFESIVLDNNSQITNNHESLKLFFSQELANFQENWTREKETLLKKFKDDSSSFREMMSEMQKDITSLDVLSELELLKDKSKQDLQNIKQEVQTEFINFQKNELSELRSYLDNKYQESWGVVAKQIGNFKQEISQESQERFSQESQKINSMLAEMDKKLALFTVLKEEIDFKTQNLINEGDGLKQLHNHLESFKKEVSSELSLKIEEMFAEVVKLNDDSSLEIKNIKKSLHDVIEYLKKLKTTKPILSPEKIITKNPTDEIIEKLLKS